MSDLSPAGGRGTGGDGSGAADGDAGTIVFRPRAARIVGHVVGIAVLVGMIITGFTVPTSFVLIDRIGFVALGVGIWLFCYREATVRVTAAPDVVTIRNLFRTTRLEWPQIVAVRFPQGDPWARLDLADGDTMGVMAIQRSDGERGIEDARRFARLVIERGEAAEPEL